MSAPFWHSPTLPRYLVCAPPRNAPPFPSPPYAMLRVLQWGLSQPPPSGSILAVLSAARPWKQHRYRPERDDCNHREDRPRPRLTKMADNGYRATAMTNGPRHQ